MAPFDPAALVGPAVDWGDERAAAGWEIARKDVRNLRTGRAPCPTRSGRTSDERVRCSGLTGSGRTAEALGSRRPRQLRRGEDCRCGVKKPLLDLCLTEASLRLLVSYSPLATAAFSPAATANPRRNWLRTVTSFTQQ